MPEKSKRGKDEELWADAKRRCRLNAETLRMARELGLNPRSLIKNNPSRSEPWKAPVHVWIGEMYAKRHRGRAELADETFEFSTSLQAQAREENRRLLRRQSELRNAAQYVAGAFARFPAVRRVVLFGSVARPLEEELPRFAEFRRAVVPLLHECRDVDLAVWVDDLSHLDDLRRARGRALNDLLRDSDIGVAHHQVDVFLMEPRTDRYLGRLCGFNQCPKGKPDCDAPGCGATPFLKQHEEFVFRPESLHPSRTAVLFDRGTT